MNTAFHTTVSSPNEELICVDDNGQLIGFKDKARCHEGTGIRHLAFSIFLFNPDGDLLLQKRHSSKLLWGGFWSNTVCSHPRRGETMAIATQRRLKDELNIESSVSLKHLYTFNYEAAFKDIGSENEHCFVFVGHVEHDLHIRPNDTEISDIKWISKQQLTEDIEAYPETYTPWFKMEWHKLCQEFKDDL